MNMNTNTTTTTDVMGFKVLGNFELIGLLAIVQFASDRNTIPLPGRKQPPGVRFGCFVACIFGYFVMRALGAGNEDQRLTLNSERRREKTVDFMSEEGIGGFIEEEDYRYFEV